MDTRICIPIPTTIDLPYNQRSWKSYAAAISDAGAIPVELDLRLSAKALEALADSCDGFLLPGSPADVDPELYGTRASRAVAPPIPSGSGPTFCFWITPPEPESLCSASAMAVSR
jgi:putative glutamine amidotransferase